MENFETHETEQEFNTAETEAEEQETTENEEENSTEKPYKWFAVQIIAKAKTKPELKKILKETDAKKYPTIIRGKEIKPEFKTVPQIIF